MIITITIIIMIVVRIFSRTCEAIMRLGCLHLADLSWFCSSPEFWLEEHPWNIVCRRLLQSSEHPKLGKQKFLVDKNK